MKAEKIKMYKGKEASNSVLEIDEIYISGCDKPGFYKKAGVHDYLKNNPNAIQVNIYPYPNLLPRVSKNGEKYVCSTSNDTTYDNLLRLPRV